MLTRCVRSAASIFAFAGFFWVCALLLLDSPQGVPFSRILGISPVLHPFQAQAILTCLVAVSFAMLLLVGCGPFLVTGIAIGTAWAALRGRPTTVSREIATAASGTLLLVAWVLLYGAAPFWVAWDSVILAGVASSTWLLGTRMLHGRENGHV